MLPEGHFFERVGRRTEERERGPRRRSEGVAYRFAVGVSDSDKPGIVGAQAVNQAVESLGVSPSLAFVAISKSRERYSNAIMDSINRVLEGVPTVGAIVEDPIMHREGLTHNGVAVALWSADESVEINSHLIKFFNRDVGEVKEEVSNVLSGGVSKKFLNVFGVVPYSYEEVGGQLEQVFLSLSEYVDLGVIGIVGGTNPSPWSIIHDGEFYSNHLSLVTIRTDYPFGMFFAYGFYPLIPMEITRVDGRFIVELDGSPAYEVFTDFLTSHNVKGNFLKDGSQLNRVLSRFQMAIPDPAAAGRFKTTVIRDVTSKGLELGIEVVEGETVWLMESDSAEILKSTVKGAMKSLSFLKGALPAGILFFENHRRIASIGEDVSRDVEGLKRAVPFPFLGIPSSQELVLHSSVLSGLHSGVVAGVLFANSE